MNRQPVEWMATHSGWLLLAPILLAEIDEDAPVTIPRWGLEWWFDANPWINDNVINAVIGMIEPDAVGYLFWGVRELKEPRTIRL